MEKELLHSVVNCESTLEENSAYVSSKRSRDDENIVFIPRKKLSVSSDSETLPYEEKKLDDKTPSDSLSLEHKEMDLYTEDSLVCHASSLVCKIDDIQEANSLEGNMHNSSNLPTVSKENLDELNPKATSLLNNSKEQKIKHENDNELSSISLSSPNYDPYNEMSLSQSLSESFEGSEIASSFSSELPFYDELVTSFDDSDPLVSLSQSICEEDLDRPVNLKIKKNKKRKTYGHTCNEKGGLLKSVRANYFVAVQVSNPEIHQAVVKIQKALLCSNEKLAQALIDVSTLHLTLLVAHIASEEDLHVACSALDHCGASLSEEFSNIPVYLKFNGLSHFKHQTLFAKCVEDDHYLRFLQAAGRVREIFSSMGVSLPDQKDLVPHLTIAKLSKMPRGKGKKKPWIRKIDPVSYEDHLNEDIGQQLVKGLQLLSMNKAKDLNRYYHSEREVLFDVVPKEDFDHSRCCHPRQPVTPWRTPIDRRKLHTSSSASSSSALFPWLSTLCSSRRRPPSPSFPHRTIATTLVSGVALLSFAFFISRWMRRR